MKYLQERERSVYSTGQTHVFVLVNLNRLRYRSLTNAIMYYVFVRDKFTFENCDNKIQNVSKLL